MAPVFKSVNMPDEEADSFDASNNINGDLPANNFEIFKQGRTNVDELTAELRHKYLTILKSNYWEFFEEGQCNADSIQILIESADRCMDDES
jgi:hypothetical protein